MFRVKFGAVLEAELHVRVLGFGHGAGPGEETRSWLHGLLSVVGKSGFDIGFCDLGCSFIKGALEGPLDADGIGDTLDQYLIVHGFPGEFGVVAVLELEEGDEAPLVKVDVVEGAPRAEVLVQEPHYVLGRHGGRSASSEPVLGRVQFDAGDEKSATFLVKGADTSQVIFVGGVS